ncbi:MAG: sensor histidine kinase [Candidatus Sericytochromatia bacterium]
MIPVPRLSPTQKLMLLALPSLAAAAVAGGLFLQGLAALEQAPASIEAVKQALWQAGAMAGAGLALSLLPVGWHCRRRAAEPDDMARLSAICEVLVRESEIEALTGQALETILRELGLSRGMVLLHDEAAGHLALLNYRGGPSPFLEAIDQVPIRPDSPWLAGHAAFHRRVVGLREVDSEPSLAPLRRQLAGLEIRGLVAVPVVVGDRLIGVLVLARPDRDFTDREVGTIRLIGHHMGFAIESARAFRSLQAAEQLKSDFVANVSHELRTPLTAIKGAATVLQVQALPAESRRFVEMIETHTERLGRLIQDLLDLSDHEAGRVDYVMAPLAIEGLLLEVRDRRQGEAVRRGVRLELDSLPALPPVVGDRDRLLEVLTHLVDNGLKFTPAGGTVRLAASMAGERVQIEVADTGPGIPPEAQGRLFDPFFQGDPGLTNTPGGAGLGLPLSRQLIEAHSGSLEVESAPGRGCAIRFTLEAAQAPIHLGK